MNERISESVSPDSASVPGSGAGNNVYAPSVLRRPTNSGPGLHTAGCHAPRKDAEVEKRKRVDYSVALAKPQPVRGAMLECQILHLLARQEITSLIQEL